MQMKLINSGNPSNSICPAGTKWAFTTRRVSRHDVCSLSSDLDGAVSGDLVLGQIVKLGHHKRLQLANGRPSTSYVGDHVVMVVGDRYAPDQFEGISVLDRGKSDMLAGGGVLGTMRDAHGRMSAPTKVKPLGLLTNREGEVINIASYALSPAVIPQGVRVIGVFGASMNAGKTTAAVSLAHGLKQAGYQVAGVKATGTGAFGDFNAFLDAGIAVSDFTDAGMATTYRMPMDRVSRGFDTLVGHAAKDGAEVVVVEIADGIFQSETAAILTDPRFRERFDAVMFAAPDALSAVGGVQSLRQHGMEPFAVSGMVTRSPLACKEATLACGVPMISRESLLNGERVQAAVAKFLSRPGTETRMAA